MNIDRLVDTLQVDEGTGPMKTGRHMPYRDSVGLLTIGFGRCIERIGITPDEAEYLLANDIARTVSELTAVFPWFPTLDDVRQRAVANLTFNIGLDGVLKFAKMLHAIQMGDWVTAEVELLSSLYARQVGQRAVRLGRMLRTGDDPA